MESPYDRSTALVSKILKIGCVGILLHVLASSWNWQVSLLQVDKKEGKVKIGTIKSVQESPGILSRVAAKKSKNHSVTTSYAIDGTIVMYYDKKFFNLGIIEVDIGLGILQRSPGGPVPHVGFSINF